MCHTYICSLWSLFFYILSFVKVILLCICFHYLVIFFTFLSIFWELCHLILNKENKGSYKDSNCVSMLCYRFAASGDVQRHIIIHSGEKPHLCDICGRGMPLSLFVCLNWNVRSHFNLCLSHFSRIQQLQ